MRGFAGIIREAAQPDTGLCFPVTETEKYSQALCPKSRETKFHVTTSLLVYQVLSKYLCEEM
jgi:hypothetical protein